MGGNTLSKLATTSPIFASILRFYFSLTNGQKFVFVAAMSNIIGYWIPNFFLYLIWKYQLFLKYKIQGDAFPPQALIDKEIKENIFATFVGVPAAAYVFYKLITLGKKKRSEIKEGKDQEEKDGDIQIENQEEKVNKKSSEKEEEKQRGGHIREGWSHLRFTGKPPAWWVTLSQVLIGYFGYDFMFYWSHRLLHHPLFYKRFHALHHKFYATIGIASSYASFTENAIQSANWFIPIGIAGYLFKDLHISVVLAYNLFRWIETVEAHCGYVFPFSLFTWIPIFGGAGQHDFHHSCIFGNYGASRIWDFLMGTRIPEYLTWKATAHPLPPAP